MLLKLVIGSCCRKFMWFKEKRTFFLADVVVDPRLVEVGLVQ